jgi:hypothetical protein
MNFKSILMTGVLALGLALGAHAAEADLLKADLIGQSMGGRENSWKFQSADQIKALTIQKKDEDVRKRVYTVALELQATKDAPRYAAEARVEYLRTGTGWKIQNVGLLSLKQLK